MWIERQRQELPYLHMDGNGYSIPNPNGHPPRTSHSGHAKSRACIQDYGKAHLEQVHVYDWREICIMQADVGIQALHYFSGTNHWT
jgi:hypothetical protein